MANDAAQKRQAADTAGDPTIFPVVAVIALAVTLVVVGLLRSPPVDWAQLAGNLLPGVQP
jgi:hypothetical protein